MAASIVTFDADWPLCYGRPIPADMADAHAHAKAWKEMGHRYLAGALGLLIVCITIPSWRARQSSRLAAAIVVLVLFQATLGMWTVTMLLKPAIVTAHLLGGMATLALLIWLAFSQYEHAVSEEARKIRIPAALAVSQISLSA
jgi:cytochrome c oxidase assembly protein subunit 15